MKTTSNEKRKPGKSDTAVPAMAVGAIARALKILGILVLATFVFAGCDEEVEEVIPVSVFRHQGSGYQTGVVYGENIVVSFQGSGGLSLSGTCNFAQITLDGSGSFNSSSLEIREAEVISRGSGHSYIWVTGRLNINIQGSGNVYYSGNPQIISNIQGTGRLIKN